MLAYISMPYCTTLKRHDCWLAKYALLHYPKKDVKVDMQSMPLW